MNLDECKREMRSIVTELRDIEFGVRRDFTNIGQDLCGNCIDKIASKYEYVSRELNKVDKNLIASLIEAATGEG
ncbi:MAG: hypothetical protein FWH04_06600 [Oscillospiraceae bacterium]|nr:hypothetical protein [Oscillospiraceae bacterium]